MFLYTLSVSASVKQSREERVARSSILLAYCMMRCYLKSVFCEQEKSSVTVIYRLWRRNYYLDCF